MIPVVIKLLELEPCKKIKKISSTTWTFKIIKSLDVTSLKIIYKT